MRKLGLISKHITSQAGHIAKYLQKQTQPGNEIWSVNRNALLKNHGENERERERERERD